MGRTFLTVALVLSMATVFGLQSRTRPQQGRAILDSDAGQIYMITLDGKFAAWAKSPKPAGSQVAPSQIKVLLAPTAGKGGGDVAMEEMTLMAKPMYEWIRASMHGDTTRKQRVPGNAKTGDITLKRGAVGGISKSGDIALKRGVVRAAPYSNIVLKRGVIQSFTPDMKPIATTELSNAMISEITFPALDAARKEPAYMTIKIHAENVIHKKGDGKMVEGQIAPATKKWQSSNFKVDIGDLPCSRVSKVSSLTWKQGVAKDEVGRSRERTGHVNNLKITLPMQDWNAWENWMTRSLLSSEGETTGSITFLGPDMTESYTIELLNVGIIAMSAEKATTNSDRLQTFVVELQINETDFSFVSR